MATLMEELETLGDKILAHRKNTKNRAVRVVGDLTEETRDFYNKAWNRYGKILTQTQKIHNACTQYTIDCGHGVFNIGLAATGLFSSVAGWSAYSFGTFGLCTRNAQGKIDNEDPAQIRALRDFLEHVNWTEFDLQIANQFKDYLQKYEQVTCERADF